MKFWISRCGDKYFLSSTKDSMCGVEILPEWGEEIMGKTETPIELTITKNIKEGIEERSEKFKKRCEEFIPKYGKEMVYRFVWYWTESNGRKMRWEMQKVFDIARRMGTWHNREKERASWQKPQQVPQPRSKSVDDLIFKYENGKH